MGPFDENERASINTRLQEYLHTSDVCHRPAQSGRLAYIEGYRVVELANEIFGFDGWSCEIRDMREDYVAQSPDTRKWSAGYACTVRVVLRDGTFREDIGYGDSQSQPQQGAAREIARKSAATDGLKRALRLFGRALGLCLYNTDFLASLARKAAMPGAAAGRPPAQTMAPRPPAPPAAIPRAVHVPPPGHRPQAPAAPSAPVIMSDMGMENFEFSLPDNIEY